MIYEVTTISEMAVDVFANNEFEAKCNSLDAVFSDHSMVDYDLIGVDLAEEEFEAVRFLCVRSQMRGD